MHNNQLHNKLKTISLTKPQSPFTPRNSLPYKTRVEQHINTKPSKQLQDYLTIEWFRKRCGNNAVKSSLFSLLPKITKENISIHEPTRYSSKEIVIKDKKAFRTINPKYLFNESTFAKIVLLRDIFLEFDKDGGRKMELNGMQEMFKENHLKVSINELVELFFEGKKIKKKDIMKLYLDFKEFVTFALEKDQEFREFMRSLREMYVRSSKYNSNQYEIESNFLPMNFDLVLDFFITKGKERLSKEKIINSLKHMEEVVTYVRNKESKKNEIAPTIPFDDTQLQYINFDELFNEFAKLMKIEDYRPKTNNGVDNNNNNNYKRRKLHKKSISCFSEVHSLNNSGVDNDIEINNEKHEQPNDPVFLNIMRKLQEKNKKKCSDRKSGSMLNLNNGYNTYYNNSLHKFNYSSTTFNTKSLTSIVLPTVTRNRFTLIKNHKKDKERFSFKKIKTACTTNMNTINPNANCNENEYYSTIIKDYLQC